MFLETSALGRALFGEDAAAEVNDRLRRATTIVASRLLKVEIERAVLGRALDDAASEKLLPRFDLELRRLWPRVHLIEMTRAICEDAGRLAPQVRLRTLDAIHVATFRRVLRVDPTITLLTFDDRIREAT